MGDVEKTAGVEIGCASVAEPAETIALVYDGLALLTAFHSIADEEIRRSLVTLAGALAKTA